jgi:hypothetical protein
MAPSELDKRFAAYRPKPATSAWMRKHGWQICALMTVGLLAFSVWAISSTIPAAAPVPFVFGVAYLVATVKLYRLRTRGNPSTANP